MTKTAVGAGTGAAFAAASGTVALAWTVTGRGFPFGPDDARNGSSLLRGLDAEVGAPVFAGVLLLTAVAMLLLRGRHDLPRAVRPVVLGFLWAVIVALLIVVPDVRVLTLAGYLPMVIIGFPFGWPPVDYSTIFTPTLAAMVVSLAGGLLLAGAVLRWQFRSHDACLRCGRGPGAAHWSTPAGAARWGRWAAWTAAAIPASYAVVRLAWAAGIPLGITPEFLADMQESGIVWAGAGLGTFALAGSVLTMGLVQRWGEVFPRWMIGLAGKRVPIRLATVPATLVALFVASASLGFITSDGFFEAFTGDVSLATAPMLLWPLWSAALGAATLAYYLRRRPPCTECGGGYLADRAVLLAADTDVRTPGIPAGRA